MRAFYLHGAHILRHDKTAPKEPNTGSPRAGEGSEEFFPYPFRDPGPCVYYLYYCRAGGAEPACYSPHALTCGLLLGSGYGNLPLCCYGVICVIKYVYEHLPYFGRVGLDSPAVPKLRNYLHGLCVGTGEDVAQDRKSTRLNS